MGYNFYCQDFSSNLIRGEDKVEEWRNESGVVVTSSCSRSYYAPISQFYILDLHRKDKPNTGFEPFDLLWRYYVAERKPTTLTNEDEVFGLRIDIGQSNMRRGDTIAALNTAISEFIETHGQRCFDLCMNIYKSSADDIDLSVDQDAINLEIRRRMAK